MHAKFRTAEGSWSALGTVLQVYAADSNRPFKVVDFGCYSQGIGNLAVPIKVQLIIQTDAGTGGTVNTPKKLSREITDAIQATGLDNSGGAFSGEPTLSDILHEWFFHPQGGYEKPLVKPYEIASGERVAIYLPAAPDEAVDAISYIEIEE